VKNTPWETQTHTGKWARALKIWLIINLSGSDKVKEKKKQISGSVSLYIKLRIPGTHGRLITINDVLVTTLLQHDYDSKLWLT
jgi:hypothetical protein